MLQRTNEQIVKYPVMIDIDWEIQHQKMMLMDWKLIVTRQYIMITIDGRSDQNLLILFHTIQSEAEIKTIFLQICFCY